MSLLETLASAFKGGCDRVPLARTYNSPWVYAENSPGRMPFDYNLALRRGYLENPVAQRTVRLVSEGIASAPILESEAPLASLVTDTSAGQALLESLASHLLLHGNAYVQVIKDACGYPVELFALRPERMSVIAAADGWPSAFSYKVGEQKLTIPVLDEDASPNLIHIRHFHPADDHYGAGCLNAADQAIATHNAAANWNRQLLENAARPSGALVYEAGDNATLTPDQFDRLKDELSRAFAGHPNAGRPMLLEGGLKWQSMSMSPADMDFATLKAAAARDIALAFGVPPMLLGLPGDATYANYREANRALWRLTLLPLAAKIFAALSEGLASWFPDAKLAVDLDRIPALSEDRERLWKQVNEAHARTDALLHCAVEGEAAEPPAEPDEGECWIVSPDATGEWTGKDGCIACRQGGNWLFANPQDGMRVLDRSTGQDMRFLSNWKIPTVPLEPTGGSVVDAEARAVLGELIAALRVSGAFPTV